MRVWKSRSDRGKTWRLEERDGLYRLEYLGGALLIGASLAQVDAKLAEFGADRDRDLYED